MENPIWEKTTSRGEENPLNQRSLQEGAATVKEHNNETLKLHHIYTQTLNRKTGSSLSA